MESVGENDWDVVQQEGTSKDRGRDLMDGYEAGNDVYYIQQIETMAKIQERLLGVAKWQTSQNMPVRICSSQNMTREQLFLTTNACPTQWHEGVSDMSMI